MYIYIYIHDAEIATCTRNPTGETKQDTTGYESPQPSPPAQIDLFLLSDSSKKQTESVWMIDKIRMFSLKNMKAKLSVGPSVRVGGPYASTNAQADREGSQPVLSCRVCPAPRSQCALPAGLTLSHRIYLLMSFRGPWRGNFCLVDYFPSEAQAFYTCHDVVWFYYLPDLFGRLLGASLVGSACNLKLKRCDLNV